jgi:hypothetical protein
MQWLRAPKAIASTKADALAMCRRERGLVTG